MVSLCPIIYLKVSCTSLLLLTLYYISCFHLNVATDTLENFVVAGYLPEWRFEQIDYNSISPFLTHLLLFSIEVDNNGDLCELNRLPSPLKLKEIREITHKHNTKLIISFGGFGRSNGFPIISIDEHLRKRFVTNALQFINEYEMEGIDLNWVQKYIQI